MTSGLPAHIGSGQAKGLWGSMSSYTAIVRRFEHACAYRIAHATISARSQVWLENRTKIIVSLTTNSSKWS